MESTEPVAGKGRASGSALGAVVGPWWLERATWKELAGNLALVGGVPLALFAALQTGALTPQDQESTLRALLVPGVALLAWFRADRPLHGALTDGTAVVLMTAPVPRSVLLAVRTVLDAFATSVVAALAVLGGTLVLGTSFEQAAAMSAAAAVGTVAYLPLWSAVRLQWQRGWAAALAFVVLWDWPIAAGVPFRIRWVALGSHVLAVGGIPPAFAHSVRKVFIEPARLPAPTAAAVLCAAAVAALAWGVWRWRRLPATPMREA